MIEYLGSSPIGNCDIVKVPSHVMESINKLSANLDNAKDGESVDHYMFERFIVMLGAMSKAELYLILTRVETMSAGFSAPESIGKSAGVIKKKLEGLFVE